VNGVVLGVELSFGGAGKVSKDLSKK